MRALAISPNERKYIPKDFKSEETPPAFTLKSMPKEKYLQLLADADIKVSSSDEGAGQVEVKINDDIWKTLLNNYKTNIAVLETNVTGWENILDECGEQLAFGKASLNLLDENIIAELVKEITGGLTKEDEKN